MPDTQVTAILVDPEIDADERARRILPYVYAQLRAAANMAMAHERSDHTLDATALVHEAYIKLIGNREVPWQNRGHFYTAAAESIRQILLDHARATQRVKRGGGQRPVSLELASVEDLASADFQTMLAVDTAFQRLEGIDPRAARVARLRIFAGLTNTQVAQAMEVSVRTVEREWAFARRWMARELLEGGDDHGLGEGQVGS